MIHAQARVSGVMTNAPFMFTVDCDKFLNNPQVFLHAMCILLGSKDEKDKWILCSFLRISLMASKMTHFGNHMIVTREVSITNLLNA